MGDLADALPTELLTYSGRTQLQLMLQAYNWHFCSTLVHVYF